ncbi:unnamed protein product [Rotaria sordida]|uniref:Protein kinase domain-containing protein n=1 Tax=Rotaria sordida TaxID=392033 RepID=A0A815RDW8_9BILA|nr:unnamed protein product [Rotaria sordida]CAF1298337.1 unnamed protein product [Rotaria sordida]CAF1342098.1 unnamed protein product [Rotaria sordida]CAF1361560.1 unnamed protein product [Rotaria sordida]CAF1361713.1 unnamed protein product [Rotaria sordida]
MGGIFSRISQFFSGDEFIGGVMNIHGVPYKLQRRIGTGGFANVYAGKGPKGTPVAIKIINLNGLPPFRSQSLVQTYLNEVTLLERLRIESRHVVVIHDFDFDPRIGLGYIVMELGGDNLMTLIDRLRASDRTRVPSIDLVMIKGFWRQMVSIVATLHAHSIVHMDLKPANLILFGRTLKIVDLGISRKANALGRAGVGTPQFSAPEVMQDKSGLQRSFGPQVDIWSLGAILYYMVYGRAPAYHPSAAMAPFGLHPPPDSALNDVLRRTLVLNPHMRADIHTLLHHPFTRM